MKTNHLKYYSASALYNFCYILTTGSVIQGFMLEGGISEKYVSFYVSAMQMVQVIVMLLMSGRVEKTKNTIKATSLSMIFQLFLPLALLIFSISENNNPAIVFSVIFLLGAVANVSQGIYNVLAYKLPYHIFDIKDYGKVLGTSGIFVFIIGTLVSFTLSYTTENAPYFKVMKVFFLLAFSALILSGITVGSYKDLFKPENKEKQNEKGNILLYKPFYILIVPNLLRGFCAGVFGVAAVIGFKCNVFDGAYSNTLLLLGQGGTLLGYFGYLAAVKKYNDGSIILTASLLSAVLFPFMLFERSVLAFSVIYFILNFIFNFINTGVPVAVTKFVPYEFIGRYSALRMLTHTLGVAIGGSVAIFMVEAIGGNMTLALSGICQLISGIAYFVVLKKYSIENEN